MTEADNITINGVEYIRADSIKAQQKLDGNYSIIRGDRSGVFFGIITYQENRHTTVKDCRRIWYWDGAASLSQLANDGTSVPSKCKFPAAVQVAEILDVIEIIHCTEKATASIKGVQAWEA